MPTDAITSKLYFMRSYSRSGVSTVDTSDQRGAIIAIPRCTSIWFLLAVSYTGSPTSTDIRCAIETRPLLDLSGVSGYTIQQEIVRFQDITSTSAASRYCRLSTTIAAATLEAAAARTDLSAAAGAATVRNGPIAQAIQVVTRVQTLSGGTSPTVSIALSIDPM